MAGIPTAPTADIPTVSAVSTAPQVLAWFTAECTALDASLQNDWLDAGCPDGSGDGCYASPASDARFQTLFASVHTWLNAALQSFSKDQLEGRATDLPEDIRALWDACATQFRILRSLVSYTDLGAEQEQLAAALVRIDERAARLKAFALTGGAGGEDADSDDELVRCPPNCGDCGGLRYGCGITRGDERRWSEPEVEEPHPMDGPQSFQAITASLTVCGGTSHYSAGLLWVPADSFETVEQIGMVVYAIKNKISPWQAHNYSHVYWAATTPDPRPEAEAAEPVDGLYGIRAWAEFLGSRPLPLAHDGEYVLGCISHHNMAAWSFKVETVTEGTPEYERYCALQSVWEHLGIEIEHAPYVSKEAYAAYYERLIREQEERHRAWQAKQAAKRREDSDGRYARERRAHYDACDRAALAYDEAERW